jgi:hypothetical protein
VSGSRELDDGAQGEPLEECERAILLSVGTPVRLSGSLAYLKTADPMPMLRPPDLVDPGEIGQVVECRALGVVAVRFRRGTFLLDQARLSLLAPGDTAPH